MKKLFGKLVSKATLDIYGTGYEMVTTQREGLYRSEIVGMGVVGFGDTKTDAQRHATDALDKKLIGGIT